MSRLTEMIVRSQQLSVAAKEEAQRVGRTEIDLEHLLVALAVVGGPSSDVLRGAGLSVRTLRDAAVRVHERRIAGLGITAARVDPGPIPDPSLGDVGWSRPADAAFRALDGLDVDDRAILVALLDEPSGHVLEVLAEGGVDAGALRSRLDAAPRPHREVSTDDGPGWRSVGVSGFVEARPEQVWSLVSDPARRLEWDKTFYSSYVVGDDGVARARAEVRRPDGTEQRHRPQVLATEHREVERVEGSAVEWEITWPDLPAGRMRQRFRVELEPDGDSTRLRLTQRWSRGRGLRGAVQRALLPVQRFLFRQQLLAKAASVSRVLR
ncbi:polyketide cyclase / dehydrase family protein [Sanguibacter keddieii DSM 10542]|uniref:Polyketide cyclase / dehydrase family protein n=1 Tax=Sanguibacter keddieii (strain ATCC 51767 / DSM 10542 / NCFB 3025 / ST-74) TaxID=446469 RepID=D1BK16_SANKS|nr:SRPBCC family protein [Sanguibacter keddieii]ACZ22425.1 polyketide cyclase / dehydrase family protein [Sanguibacter keddieii DSM 10542]